ncbi:uncharacterized protein LOC144438679 [Glandiceps talaboti]
MTQMADEMSEQMSIEELESIEDKDPEELEAINQILNELADFESITEKVNTTNNNTVFTQHYQKHEVCSFGYKLVCCYDDTFSKKSVIYRGSDASKKFMEKMLSEVDYCNNIKQQHFNKPLRMSKNDENCFQKATQCHICETSYEKDCTRVRDHCHITGKYRGSAHESCNINFQVTKKIPVIFHNLKGYDSHFIVQTLENVNEKINIIPHSMEKFMAIMVGTNLVFIDSLNFLNASLEKLVSNTSDFKYTEQEFPNSLKLLTRKGVYPYDYMDSIKKFDDVNLPLKETFYSILNETGITDEDYKHAQDIWKHFNMQTMGDYLDLYLKTDVLLLTDIFENFRKTCNLYYNLDPCHYFSAPGLSWDACLKMTKINLELLTDIDMHLFIEKGLRGGISYISAGHAKANNPYMKDHDPTQESKYIMYLDANNLYGWAMVQSLPTDGFKWVDVDSLDCDFLSKYTNESDHGLILEVDLEYPSELHDLHNDYPLAPERLCVTEDMLSPHNKKIRDLFNIKCGNIEKLTTTLKPKRNYVLHFQNLKQ